jgi:hypothetical protein
MSIELFYDTTKFIFRKAGRDVGWALFADLKLDHAADLPAEEIHEMQWLLGNYQMGEVMTDTLVKGKVLGPAREFELEVTLHACGNPDHQQYADVGPKKTVRVCGDEEAAAATLEYQSNYEMGQGNIAPTHGKVWRMAQWQAGRRKHVGWVTFGGRYETIAERKAAQSTKQKNTTL